MVDFSKLTKRPAGLAVAAPPLMVATYPGVVKSFEYIEAPKDKDYEIIIRFHVGLTGWPESVPEEDRSYKDGEGKSISIDLSKKQLRRDFYDNNLVFLDNFLRSCGVDPGGRTYEEVLPEVVGAPIDVQVQQYMNQRNNTIGNNVGDIMGQHGG